MAHSTPGPARSSARSSIQTVYCIWRGDSSVFWRLGIMYRAGLRSLSYPKTIIFPVTAFPTQDACKQPWQLAGGGEGTRSKKARKRKSPPPPNSLTSGSTWSAVRSQTPNSRLHLSVPSNLSMATVAEAHFVARRYLFFQNYKIRQISILTLLRARAGNRAQSHGREVKPAYRNMQSLD